MTDQLTPKQALFVSEYLADFNGKAAAIRAGYSPKTAEQQASRLLRHVQVKAAVDAGRELMQAEICHATGITQEWVVTQLKDVAQRCMAAVPVPGREGEFTFNAAGANKSLELIGKHIGMFKEDKASGVNVSIENLQLNVTQVTAQVDELLDEYLGEEAEPPTLDS